MPKWSTIALEKLSRCWCVYSIVGEDFTLCFSCLLQKRPFVMTALWPRGSCSLDLSIWAHGRSNLASVGPEHVRRTPDLLILPGEFSTLSPPAVRSCLLSSTKLGHVWSGASSPLTLPPLPSNTLSPLQVTPLLTCAPPALWRTLKLSVTSTLGVVCCSDLLWLILLLSYCVSLLLIFGCNSTPSKKYMKKYMMLWN